jgi:hypothetical protein
MATSIMMRTRVEEEREDAGTAVLLEGLEGTMDHVEFYVVVKS